MGIGALSVRICETIFGPAIPDQVRDLGVSSQAAALGLSAPR